MNRLSSFVTFGNLGRALTLTNLCRLFALLMVAWQPFPGEYRVPLVGSALLGPHHLLLAKAGVKLPQLYWLD
ncbi:hypothetical protein C7K55_12550 [Cyanobium usitatum str. Tous]|uniref:Uncharacterized protein n=1 Tax=Cyanobium usitatum str. Tous TaxID=2116684 RepID=A0A2P7MQP5_9CYAN|nr:hypothetical protein C7K55_12550 [Cyanobium usitatum str. Tous]